MFATLGLPLFFLYLKLTGGVLIGLISGWFLPKNAPVYLGKFLFWIGVPLGIFAFLRRADLSQSIWLAPVTAWVAIFTGALFAWIWLRGSTARPIAPPAQGSLLLAAMFGNTGYLGFPVTLALVGEKYFAWALFYDMAGSLVGAYGLGVALAARFGTGIENQWKLTLALLQNPALWSFGVGLLVRDIPLPVRLEQGLQTFAWAVIGLSLVLIGMRLSQLSSWRSLKPVSVSLAIKMVVVPLILGAGLPLLGVAGPIHLVLVLQMAMPPAFATLVLAEVYNLERELAVSALAAGSVGLLFTLPLWLWLFGG
jgi:predicted permease